jgi:hypothetical protein
MLKLAVVGTTSLAVFGGGQPVFAQAAFLNRVRMRFIPTC